MLGQTNNPTLQQIEQEVQSKVPQDMQNAFQRIVTGGLKIMYDPKTHEMVSNQLNQEGDPSDVAGEGVAKLIGLLYKESKGTMPIKAAIPAAQILLCEGLDFMEKAGRIELNNDTIAKATQDMIGYLLQLFGFKQEQIAEYMKAGAQQQGQGATEQPPQGAETPQAAPASAGIIGAAQGAQ